MNAVDRFGAVAFVQLLQLRFDVGERVRVQQLSELGFAQQLLQLNLIDRQCLRAPLGEGGVSVVEIVGDVGEQQRGGKR